MCFAIFALVKFMCFGSTLSYPHKEFLNPCLPHTRTKHNPPHSTASSTRTHPIPARKAVRVPAPALQMQVPATHAG